MPEIPSPFKSFIFTPIIHYVFLVYFSDKIHPTETLWAADLKFFSLSRFETIGERTQLQDILLGQLSCRGLIALFIFMLIY